MADEGPKLANPARFWGKVMAMVSDRADTRTLWQGIRAEAAKDGLSFGPDILQAVTTMRSAAVRLRTASETIGRASPTDSITAAMKAETIYARSPQERGAMELWHVRFTVPVTTADGTVDRWYMMQIQGQYPQTVGELMDNLAAYAAALAGSYGAEFGDVGSVQLGVY